MQVSGWDFARGKHIPNIGLAGLAHRIEALRSDAPLSIYVDNGDFSQGTLFADWHVTEWRFGRSHPHPMLTALKSLDCDAIGLGNHEFDYGMEYLLALCEQSEIPIHCSNLQDLQTGAPPPSVHYSTMVERRTIDADGNDIPIRIGLLSVLPPQTEIWNRPALAGRYTLRPMEQVLREGVITLKAAGADLVIGLCHSGVANEAHPSVAENQVVRFARIEGLDALVAGHSHGVFPSDVHESLEKADLASGTIYGKPVVMPGSMGSHLGQIDLTLRHSLDTGWQVLAGRGQLHLSEALPDTEGGWSLPASISALQQQCEIWAEKPMGHTQIAIQNHFDHVKTGSASPLLGKVMIHEIGSLAEKAGVADIPMLAAVAPLNGGSLLGHEVSIDIAPGPIRRADAAMLFPFPDRVCAIMTDGEGLYRWLERAAASYAQLVPAEQDQDLLGPNWIGHHFDIIYGLNYCFDLSQPAVFDGSERSRVTNVYWQGKPLDPSQKFLLVTSEYRANGSGDYPGSGPDSIFLTSELTCSEALEKYLSETGEITDVDDDPIFELCDIDGASVLLEIETKGSMLPPPNLEGLQRIDDASSSSVRYRLTFGLGCAFSECD